MSGSSNNTNNDLDRVWVDGCFDMLHYGHSNALRQAKEMGKVLVVGIHSDKEIELNKGPTVFKELERYEVVRACKWVDEVVEDAPYLTSLPLLNQHTCHFCIHGDDSTSMADGSDCYGGVKAEGRYREFRRTEGVSTTELVGRMLQRRERPEGVKPMSDPEYMKIHLPLFLNHPHSSTNATTQVPASSTTTTTKNTPNDIEGEDVVRVLVVCNEGGSFDLFHGGHLTFLQEVRKQVLNENSEAYKGRKGRRRKVVLVVGLCGDEEVKDGGGRYPILDMYQRALGCLAFREVDDILFNVPYKPSHNYVEGLKEAGGFQVYCTTSSGLDWPSSSSIKLLSLSSHLTQTSSDKVIERILDNYEVYAERNRRKEAKSLQELNIV